FDAKVDGRIFSEGDPVCDRALEPVGAEGRRVKPEVIALTEQVVPERVDADARAEAKIEERRGDDAGLLVRTEKEEIPDGRRPLILLRRRDEPAERASDDELTDEIERRQEDARDPQRHVAGGRGGLSPALIIGQRALWSRRSTLHRLGLGLGL